MNVPADLKYTKSHEWVKLEADGSVTVGITDHAQEALGDIVFLDLPEAGRQLNAGEECAVVESVKAASDIYAPVAGEVIARAEHDAVEVILAKRDGGELSNSQIDWMIAAYTRSRG